MKNTKQSKILQLIKHDKPARNHFFKKLATTGNPFSLLIPLKDEGYFEGSENLEPREDPNQKGLFSIPFWNVLGYLENVAKQNAKKPDSDITRTLLDIIDSITTWKKPKTKKRVDNYHTDYSILKIISYLPIETIQKKHIELIRVFLKTKWDATLISSGIEETILLKLIENKRSDLLLGLLEIILDYKVDSESYVDRVKPLMDKYWLKEALDKHKPKIAELCALDAAEIALKKINSILAEDDNALNFLTISSIEDHEQNWLTDSYEYIITFFTRDMFVYGDASIIKPKVEELLSCKYSILQRLGLHAINKHYKELKTLFWSWKPNPLDEIKCAREIYSLINEHCEELSEEEIERYLKWVENRNIDDEKDIKRIAYRKKEWLLPFREKDKYKNHTALNKLFEIYEKINPATPEHPGWTSWSESWSGNEEVFNRKEFLSKLSTEQVGYVNNYQFENGWRKPTTDDLSYNIQQVVTEHPEKFAKDIMFFAELKRDSDRLAILRGLEVAWNNGKDYSWNNIFEYCESIFKKPNFWTKKYDSNEYNYRNAFISEVSNLLTAGMREDSHAFDLELLPNAKELLLYIAPKVRSMALDEKPSISEAINSAKYHFFSAIMNYALRYGRTSKKEKSIRWEEDVKKYFIEGLDKKKEPSLHNSIALGKYFINMRYLDKKWVDKNINKIFPQNLESHWQATFTGYLSMGKLYQDVYLLLKRHGHYQKALDTTFEREHDKKLLVQHICLGYLNGEEELDDPRSLISQLLTDISPKAFQVIVYYLHAINSDKQEILNNKILSLWERLHESLKNIDNLSEYEKAIQQLFLWLDMIDRIDDKVVEWVNFSVDHIRNSWDIIQIPKCLLRHVNKTPKEVGEIYVYLVNKGIFPDFREEDIQKLISSLYTKKEKEAADEICRLYQSKGITILEDIYNKFQTNLI